MDVVSLARWQFAMTCTYHFLFVPLTLGLATLVAIMQTVYVRTGDEHYRRMTQFWGKLFLINFIMGLATGIVMEFQFGMNWSEYSRFVGDVFGAPLAIEALLAFFLESTFLGVWVLGWDKLPKKVHLASIWLAAFGTNLSAAWILIANSFMQEPVGYALRNGRAEMVSILALVTNPNVLVQFPHVVLSGVATAGFFVLCISAWHLARKSHVEFFQSSFRIGGAYALIGILGVVVVGHAQTQHIVQSQPMKLAAAEALWDTESPASLSLFAIPDAANQRNRLSVRVPGALSFLAYGRPTGEVKGIRDLEKEYQQRFGPGNYTPPVGLTYWSFRLMVGAGLLMALAAAYALYVSGAGRLASARGLRWLPLALVLPYVANSAGWMMAELGRQPWIVFGLLKTEDAVSPVVSAAAVLGSLIVFTSVYGLLMVVDVQLLKRYAQAGPAAEDAPAAAVAY